MDEIERDEAYEVTAKEAEAAVTAEDDALPADHDDTAVFAVRPKEKPYTLGADLLDWFDTIIYSVLAIVVVFTFITRMSTVDGTSMVPTLEDGQHLMIENVFYTPAYNDIVVVYSEKLPNEDGGRGKAIVKRVIGLPGDQIEIDYAHGTVTRNGVTLEQEVKNGILYEDGHIINTYTNDEEGLGGSFTVPEGSLFVMGDNRNGSTDSRSYLVGYIDIRDIVGKAYLRVTPLDKFGGLYD